MDVRLVTNPPVSVEQLNALFSAAWPDHVSHDFSPVLARSLAYVCAFDGDQLIGFVNVAWDGGVHAFLLDPTVHPDYRRRGVGTRLVTKAATEAGALGAEWLHVDYESQLGEFYRRCGFRPTSAGLIKLSSDTEGARGPRFHSDVEGRWK